jgi:hypothetical protein
VWFTRTPRGELAIACLETENPESAIRLLAASEEPFDAWFKGRLLELHGLDLRRLRPGSMPEEIFAYPDIPAHPGLEAS